MTIQTYGNLTLAPFIVQNLFGELNGVGNNGLNVAQQNLGFQVAPATYTPVTGQWTYTIPVGQGLTVFTGSGTTASGIITLPSGVTPGLPITIMSVAAVTSANVLPPAGFTSGGTTQIAMTAGTGYTYNLVGTVFYRTQ